jgi:DNA excision repair protein ERCC-4
MFDEVHGNEGTSRPHWLPDNITPVLEELPKWEHLAEILTEIEGLIMHHPIPSGMYS